MSTLTQFSGAGLDKIVYESHTGNVAGAASVGDTLYYNATDDVFVTSSPLGQTYAPVMAASLNSNYASMAPHRSGTYGLRLGTSDVYCYIRTGSSSNAAVGDNTLYMYVIDVATNQIVLSTKSTADIDYDAYGILEVDQVFMQEDASYWYIMGVYAADTNGTHTVVSVYNARIDKTTLAVTLDFYNSENDSTIDNMSYQRGTVAIAKMSDTRVMVAYSSAVSNYTRVRTLNLNTVGAPTLQATTDCTWPSAANAGDTGRCYLLKGTGDYWYLGVFRYTTSTYDEGMVYQITAATGGATLADVTLANDPDVVAGAGGSSTAFTSIGSTVMYQNVNAVHIKNGNGGNIYPAILQYGGLYHLVRFTCTATLSVDWVYTFPADAVIWDIHLRADGFVFLPDGSFYITQFRQQIYHVDAAITTVTAGHDEHPLGVALGAVYYPKHIVYDHGTLSMTWLEDQGSLGTSNSAITVSHAKGQCEWDYLNYGITYAADKFAPGKQGVAVGLVYQDKTVKGVNSETFFRTSGLVSVPAGTESNFDLIGAAYYAKNSALGGASYPAVKSIQHISASGYGTFAINPVDINKSVVINPLGTTYGGYLKSSGAVYVGQNGRVTVVEYY